MLSNLFKLLYSTGNKAFRGFTAGCRKYHNGTASVLVASASILVLQLSFVYTNFIFA